VLLLYTGGATEATSAEGEEYGAARLEAALRRHRDLNADAARAALVEDARHWSDDEPQDDLTVIVARCR
jgi:serine phosphatase RsbU (regulator of sigma subunit)